MNLQLIARDRESDHQHICKLVSACTSEFERIDRLARLLELDSENVRTLARIAEAHEHRI